MAAGNLLSRRAHLGALVVGVPLIAGALLFASRRSEGDIPPEQLKTGIGLAFQRYLAGDYDGAGSLAATLIGPEDAGVDAPGSHPHPRAAGERRSGCDEGRRRARRGFARPGAAGRRGG